MVHYHGGPFSDSATAIAVWRARHAMISFARPEQTRMAAEICQSFCLDNGAYSAWRKGLKFDIDKYYGWLSDWINHPGCDFAIIPDKIGGTEKENDELLSSWPFETWRSCAVWHMHERLSRLNRLVTEWPRVAIGSSGAFQTPGTEEWWTRIGKAMRVCCGSSGQPKTRIHGLRMLNPEIFRHLPLASADSTNVARNVQFDSRWNGPYTPMSKRVRGIVLVDRIESDNSVATWTPR